MSPQQYCSSQCNNATFVAFLQQAISARSLPDNPIVGGAGTGSAGCPTTPSSSGAATEAKITALAGAAAGVGLKVTSAIASTGAIALPSLAIPVAGVAIAVLTTLLGTIFAHHAAAEAAQSNVLCTNVPAANGALSGISQLISSGALSADDAVSAYQSLASEFDSAMRSDPSFKTGDAMWGYDQAMQAVCAQCILDLQASGATTGVAASLGVPPLLLWGAGVAALWFLL